MNQLRSVATDATEALQHAVTYAQLDDDEAKRSLRYLAMPFPGWLKHDLASADAVAIRSEVAELLRAIVEGRKHRAKVCIERQLWRDASVAPGVLLSTGGAGGSVRDLVLYRLMATIEKVGVDKVQRCAAPDCDRLFVKVTRKEFCSTRCQARINMRRQRAAVS